MNEVMNPFGGGSQITETAGGRQVTSRENTEVMAMVASAKRFPRNVIACADKIRNAFTRVTLAEKAQYQFARGGTDITGPSIRAAEAMAQQWGNMSNGWRELARFVGADGIGVSEVEAYSVDYESNGRESIQFVVRHWRDTKNGGYKLKDERDIYELCANQAQRRKRACILAQIPGDVTEMAMDQASVTLKTSADTSPEAMQKMVAAFEPFGVTKAHIEKRIQRRLDTIQPAQVVSLKRVYASLRDEMSEASDWFEVEASTAGSDGGGNVKTLNDLKGSGKTAKERADKGTGEITDVPGNAKTAGKPIGKTYAQYAHNITSATSEEAAALELDEARDVLPEDQQAELTAVFRTKFGK